MSWSVSRLLLITPVTDMISPVTNLPARSSLRASRRGDLVIPRTNRKIGDRAFAVATPRVWNQCQQT